MLCHDAPRVLSDVFQALVAAVFFDSDLIMARQTFKPILKEHILRKLFLPEFINHDGGPLLFGNAAACAASEATLFEINNYAKTTSYVSIRGAVTDACLNKVLSPGLLALGALVNTENEVLDGEYMKPMRLLRDLHLCQCINQGRDCGSPVCATPPRTAIMRCEASLNMTSETMARLATCTANVEEHNCEEEMKPKEKPKPQSGRDQEVW